MLRSALVLLLLCVLLPLHGWAQASNPGEEPAPPVTPPPLIPAPEAPQRSDEEPSGNGRRGEVIPREWHEARDPSPTIPRLLLEAALGTVGAGVGLIPGGLLAISGFCIESCDSDDESRAILGLALALAGMSAGAAAGIVGGAGIVSGQGNYWPTLGGAALGTLAGSILTVALAAANSEAGGVFSFFAGPVIGGIIGYELSHSSTIAERSASFASRPRMVPLVTVSARGGIIGGLVGSF